MHVDSNLETYKYIGAKFMAIEATDHDSFQLNKFFDETTEFVDKAVESGGEN